MNFKIKEKKTIYYKFDTDNSDISTGHGLFLLDVFLFYFCFFFIVLFLNFMFEHPDFFPTFFFSKSHELIYFKGDFNAEIVDEYFLD